MNYFSKKRFTMRQVVGLLTVVFLGIAAITYAVSFTDFTSNSTISSSEMNTKLNALKDAINKKDTSCQGNSANDSMVKVGNLCVDKYEASIWSAADGTGTAYGVFGGQTAYPGGFPANGNWTTPVYAVSRAGVLPSTSVTWFQAQQACALSGKRLLTNAEWQMAAAGTPDPGTDNGSTDCAVASASAVNTGSRSNCVSKWLVNDMVGNVWEWVADWMQGNTNPWAPSTGTTNA
ncbi:MAG: SUMF1/EgtB/PvdO family nonheme iron enzyme, partial [Nitrospirae bacterium]|nr:SUMF1/EgtB/PvdO family nonheme iron enzyme [Nitrospirota bacterium]